MTELDNLSLLHQIQAERVENGIVKDCLIVLEKANKQIMAELKKTKGVNTKARYNQIRKYIKEISKELEQHVDEGMSVEEFISYEFKAQKKIFKKLGMDKIVYPSPEQLVTSATFKPYTVNSTFAAYLESLSLNFFNTWDSQVRAGYLNGITTKKIIDNVMGVAPQKGQAAQFGAIDTLRKSVERNTRTALQSFAMESRKLIYEENEDIISGYKWLATLDTRTCLVCGKLDLEVKKKYEDFGETPPAHYNCRCVIVPVIDGVKELNEGATRASMDGQVDADLDFEHWLKMQDDATQEDILGKTRYDMYKNGTRMTDFVSDNRVVRIKDLDLE